MRATSLAPKPGRARRRRIRVIEFTSKFVENPKEANEFPVDLELSSKFESWREHFLSMLINKYYPQIQHSVIKAPEDVMLCTR
jgi:phage/plasmid-associated DNA primase